MTEISRENAQRILLQICYDGEFPNNSDKAFGRAISDMERVGELEKENAELKQKLENIEQIIKKYNLQDITRDDVDYYDYMNDDCDGNCDECNHTECDEHPHQKYLHRYSQFVCNENARSQWW